jgi:predicted dinucleotide-utilizing enzyme
MLADANERGESVPPQAGLVDRVVEEVDYMIGAGSADIHRGFEVLCRAINRSPTLVLASVSTLSELPLAERIEVLQRLESSRIGIISTLLVAFKIPISMAAYEVGPELEMTGFDRKDTTVARLSRSICVPSRDATGAEKGAQR